MERLLIRVPLTLVVSAKVFLKDVRSTPVELNWGFEEVVVELEELPPPPPPQPLKISEVNRAIKT
jgi:hypothetical protein